MLYYRQVIIRTTVKWKAVTGFLVALVVKLDNFSTVKFGEKFGNFCSTLCSLGFPCSLISVVQCREPLSSLSSVFTVASLSPQTTTRLQFGVTYSEELTERKQPTLHQYSAKLKRKKSDSESTIDYDSKTTTDYDSKTSDSKTTTYFLLNLQLHWQVAVKTNSPLCTTLARDIKTNTILPSILSELR